MNRSFFDSYSEVYFDELDFEFTEIYRGLGIPISINYSRNLFNGNAVCVGDTDGFLSLYNIFHSEIININNSEIKHSNIYSIKLHESSITEVKFENISPESNSVEKNIFLSSTDSFLTKFDIEYKKENCKLKAHKEWVKRFALSPKYFSLIATVGNDGNLCIYDDRQFHCRINSNLKNKELFKNNFCKGTNVNLYKDIYKDVERIYLVPKLELKRIHEPINKVSSRKNVVREKLISNKKISVSGVVFLNTHYYIATCGSTDSSIKIWDIRKSSNNLEKSYINKFVPQIEEDGSRKDDLRGIIWMDIDDYYNKLAVQTRKGIISIYNTFDILSCCKNLSSQIIDMSKFYFKRDSLSISEENELVDFSQRPALSSCGNWLATPSNSGSKICIFNLSDFSKKTRPYFIYDNFQEQSFPEFQCIAWKKNFITENMLHNSPLKDCNDQLGEELYVGKEYCSSFSVGTKSRYLKVFNNKEFQVKFKGSVMPDFLDSSSGGVKSKGDNTSNDNSKKLESQWVSNEALSFNSSFDGDLEAVNQLSLSSSLSIPIPKPSKGSIAEENMDISNKEDESEDKSDVSPMLNLKNSPKEKKTGFLTLKDLSFVEKENRDSLDNLYVSNPSESFEKTPFRRSIPPLGSSQDSVGYPAPQRGQFSYIVQSQENLFTPKSPEKSNTHTKSNMDTENDSPYLGSTFNYSKELNSRKVIHIPLSQSNEEVLASPSIRSNDDALDRCEVEYLKSDCVLVSEKNACNKNHANINFGEEYEGFKQRKLDSWIRIKKHTESSTTNCSTAELSPIS